MDSLTGVNPEGYGDYTIRVYIAGPFEAKDRLAATKAQINALPNYFVTSTWTEEATAANLGPLEGAGAEDAWALGLAERDISEISLADILLLDTVETNDRGGKDFESGFAYASGLEFWVIGPYRNVFHRFATRHYETWTEALEALKAAEVISYDPDDEPVGC